MSEPEIPQELIEALAGAQWDRGYLQDDEADWVTAKRMGLPGVARAREKALKDIRVVSPRIRAQERHRVREELELRARICADAYAVELKRPRGDGLKVSARRAEEQVLRAAISFLDGLDLESDGASRYAAPVGEEIEIEERGGEIRIEVEEADTLASYGPRILHSLQALHDTFNNRIGDLMVSLEALQAAVDSLVTAEGSAATEMQDLVAEIATLQAGSVTQEQIDAITGKATAAVDALNAATTSAQEATVPPVPPVEPPAPVEPPPPVPPVEPPAPEPVPVEPPAPVDPVPPVEPPPVEPLPVDLAPTKPVYQHLTTDAIDATQWPDSGFETLPTDGSAALPLFYFAGDLEGGSPTGAVDGVWQAYTGAVQAVPAPAVDPVPGTPSDPAAPGDWTPEA